MRIIGVDIGTTSIKAVEIDSAFGRYEVQEYHEQKLPLGSDPIASAARLIASLPKDPDRVVMSLKTRQVTFRNLQLPTRDKKAILAGVGFELDDDLPFSIENAAYDYTITSQTKNTSQLHVAAAPRQNVAKTLESWTGAGIDPDLLTTEAWSYRTLLNRVLSPEEQEHPVLLIQMGHLHTTLYVHWRGIPILARDFSWGGQDLTLAISQRYQIPLDQAETAKLDNGFVVPPSKKKDVTPEQIQFSDALSQPIDRLLGEIRQIDLTTRSLTGINLSLILTSGGTSLLPGLSGMIEQIINIPTRPLRALSSIATSGVTYSDNTDATFLLATSLALCMVGSERSAAVNFRTGQFAKQGRSHGIGLANFRGPAIGAAAVVFCFFLSLFVQSRIYSSQIADTNIQLERAVKNFFGNLSNSAVRTYMANTTTLKSQVTKELTRQRQLAKLTSPNPKSPLGFLKSLSESIPKDITLDMTQFQMGVPSTASYLSATEQNGSMTFLVSKPEMVARLSSIVDGKLPGAHASKQEEVPAPGGNGKRWKIVFTGRPGDESFDKWN